MWLAARGFRLDPPEPPGDLGVLMPLSVPNRLHAAPGSCSPWR